MAKPNKEYPPNIQCAKQINHYLRSLGYKSGDMGGKVGSRIAFTSFNDEKIIFYFDQIGENKPLNKKSSMSVIRYQYNNMKDDMIIRMCYYMFEHIKQFIDHNNIKYENFVFSFMDNFREYTLDWLIKQPTFSKGQLILNK